MEEKVNHYYAYLLEQAMEDGELVSVNVDPFDPEGIIVGYVEAIDNTHFLMSEYMPWGEFDSYRIRKLEGVYSVFRGEEFENRLTSVLHFRGQDHLRIRPALRKKATVYGAVLRYCHMTNQIATVYLGMQAYNGRLLGYNDLKFDMDMMNYMGQPDGQDYFVIKEVDIFQFGGGEERMFADLEKLAGKQENQS